MFLLQNDAFDLLQSGLQIVGSGAHSFLLALFCRSGFQECIRQVTRDHAEEPDTDGQ